MELFTIWFNGQVIDSIESKNLRACRQVVEGKYSTPRLCVIKTARDSVEAVVELSQRRYACKTNFYPELA
jgi:hypothetical protein